MFSNRFGCHCRILFGDLVCALQRSPLPRMSVPKAKQRTFIGGFHTRSCCNSKLVLNTCADAKQASQIHAFLLGQSVQPTEERLKSVSLEGIRVFAEFLSCTRAQDESIFAEFLPRSHEGVYQHCPQLQLLEFHVAVRQGNCFFTVAEIALCVLPDILSFALRIECRLRKLIGLISKAIGLPPQPKRCYTQKDGGKHRNCGDDNRPSIPPNDATVDAQLWARTDSLPPRHSLIPLWTRPHSAMARAPEARHA